MFIDAKQLPENHLVETDVCIIGAGAVGISMAREFDNSNINVAIIESGGFEYDKKTQSLYTGFHIGEKTYPLETNRLRYFGGTTHHWAGHCRPFTDYDFRQKDWIPHSGWPITAAEMQPYNARSQSIMELGQYDYSSIEEYAEQLKLPLLPVDNYRLVNTMKHQSPPTRFGKTYRPLIEQSKNVTVYLHSNVLRLNSNANASHVNEADIAVIDGPRYKVKAKYFVLAAGGLENPRLMLLSNNIASDGLGNDKGLVGKFYTDHLLVRGAIDISLSHPKFDFRMYSAAHQINGGKAFAILTPSAKFLEYEKMTDFRFHLFPYSPGYKAASGGVFSTLDGAGETTPLTTKAGASIQGFLAMEPIPNPDALIKLSSEKDFFNQPKLEVKWLVSEQERINAHRAIETLALEFGRMGLGRGAAPMLEEPEHWPAGHSSGKHHSGTTRMADNPSKGVIDKNCKVFGIDNLFVTGSSIFPTIGQANPTLNLIAFSLRLSDHLKKSL